MIKQAQSNKDIREAAASAGVFLWQVAEAIGVTDRTFSRKLRRELPDDDKAAVTFVHRIDESISSILFDVQNQQHLSINQVGIPL